MASVQTAFWVVALLVVLAIAFDFMNGFHDAANGIATVVSTGVLKPQQAILFATCFNVLAIFIFHLNVAATVGKGIETITGAIVGVGSVQRASAVRWGVAGNIVWAWIFTVPAPAFVAGVFYWIGLAVLL